MYKILVCGAYMLEPAIYTLQNYHDLKVKKKDHSLGREHGWYNKFNKKSKKANFK